MRRKHSKSPEDSPLLVQHVNECMPTATYTFQCNSFWDLSWGPGVLATVFDIQPKKPSSWRIQAARGSVLFQGSLLTLVKEPTPAPPDYPLRDPKYDVAETIMPSIDVH